MARQVYFDPYGMRTAGYQQGVQDETRVQDATRQARRSDFEYNNVYPLQLQQLQRQNALEQYADPYMRRAYGLRERGDAAALTANELGVFGTIGQATGDYAPWAVTAGNYGAGQAIQDPRYFAPQVQYARDVFNEAPEISQPNYMEGLAGQYGLDRMALMESMYGPSALLRPGVESGIDQYYMHPRMIDQVQMQRGLNNDQFNYGLREAQLGNSTMNALIQQLYATGRYPELAAQLGIAIPSAAGVDPDMGGAAVAVDEDGL